MTAPDQRATEPRPDATPIIRPEPARWVAAMSEFAAVRPTAAAAFRRELGLPVDRPVVMTGHQAQVWHPGILAKYLAADALVAIAGAAAAWVVVDQDTNPPGIVRLPVRRAGASNGQRRLRVETWAIDPSGEREHGDIPTSRQPALRPGPAPALNDGEVWAAPGVATGIEAIRGAMHRHAQAPCAAKQVAGALADLLRPVVRSPGVTLLSCAITRTSLFAGVLDRMRSDPAACTREYNAAVAAHSHERVQPLAPGELPLWVIGPGMGSRRRRATVADLGSTPVEHFSLRALLMTGLLRWAGCDLFIHGTGGGGGVGGTGGERAGAHHGYDRITERWLSSWLGGDVRLAPSVVATATLRLRIENAGPSPAELRRAQWLAHRARHEPRLLDDPTADAAKQGMVAEIRRIKRAGLDAKPLYRDMHALLARTRDAHGERLRTLQAAAESASERVGDADIAAERTWAFPIYEGDQIEALRSRVAAAFAD